MFVAAEVFALRTHAVDAAADGVDGVLLDHVAALGVAAALLVVLVEPGIEADDIEGLLDAVDARILHGGGAAGVGRLDLVDQLLDYVDVLGGGFDFTLEPHMKTEGLLRSRATISSMPLAWMR